MRALKKKVKCKSRVKVKDIGNQVSANVRAFRTLGRNPQKPYSFSFNAFYPLHSMNTYLDYLAENRNVTVESIGKSFQGRDIRMVKRCPGAKCGDKPGILIYGGTHAREWLSPTTVLYLIHKIFEEPFYDENLDKYDLYLLPVHNPDGYQFSFTYDPMWRKNRWGQAYQECLSSFFFFSGKLMTGLEVALGSTWTGISHISSIPTRTLFLAIKHSMA